MVSRYRLSYVPDWMSGEVEAALRQVGMDRTQSVRSLMHTTILRLAYAHATKQPMAPVFDLPDTCSETTWYGRNRRGGRKPGWSHDPSVVNALEVATERARRWEDTRISRALTEARLILVESTPDAARELKRQIDNGDKDVDRREASKAVLDRAGFETASKGQHVVVEVSAADRIAAMQRALEAEQA